MVVSQRFEELRALLELTVKTCSKEIEDVVSLLIETFSSGNKVLICGNGGSAADSQHFAAEFINAFSPKISRKALPAIALTTDTSIITSHSNDFSFDTVFARQIEGIGKRNDVLIAISTSGSSLNCLKAIEMASSMGLKTISFTRRDSVMSKKTDLCLGIPSDNTQHIQEAHQASYHVICELVENALFGNSDKK